MELARQKMNQLRAQLDDTLTKVDSLTQEMKVLKQENLQKEQEITSLSHKNQLLETEVENHTTNIQELKRSAAEDQVHGTQNETLQRKLQHMEEEAEQADKTLRETNEKLRLTDVKAGHFERKVQALEKERDQWEQKYEEMTTKFTSLQKEMQDFQTDIGSL